MPPGQVGPPGGETCVGARLKRYESLVPRRVYFNEHVLYLLEQACSTIGSLEELAHDACQLAFDRSPSDSSDVEVLAEDVLAGCMRNS